MGNLYEICYDHAIEAMESIDMKTFMQLVYGHSKFIGSLTRLLLFGEQSLKKFNMIERHQKVKKIEKMNSEFLQRVILFLSQNVDRLDHQSIERFVLSLVVTGHRYGKYTEILADLAAIYAGLIKNLELTDEEKLAHCSKLADLFRKVKLPKATQESDN